MILSGKSPSEMIQAWGRIYYDDVYPVYYCGCDLLYSYKLVPFHDRNPNDQGSPMVDSLRSGHGWPCCSWLLRG